MQLLYEVYNLSKGNFIHNNLAGIFSCAFIKNVVLDEYILIFFTSPKRALEQRLTAIN